MLVLKNSGYTKNFRKEVLNSALEAFKKMEDDDLKGVKPLYRSRTWESEDEKTTNKMKKKLNWWKNEKSKVQYKSLVFVPPTPGGKLIKELQQREEELNKNSDERIKFLEHGGDKMEKLLTNKYPFKTEKCAEKMCPLCQNEKEPTVPCNTNNAGYKWTCKTCKNRNITKVYEGETSRSVRIRGGEHLRDFRNRTEKSVLFKHQILEHKNEKAEFEMEITGVFKDALTRQADEAVRIQNRSKSQLLNSKGEFNSAPVARISVEKNYKTKQAYML